MDLMSCVAKRLPRVVLALLLAIGLVAGPIDRGTAMSASRFVRREAPTLVQTVLEMFGRPMQTGAGPCCLFEGAGGVLYGTTFYGGGNHDGGTVFALAPPPPGKKQWTETILYSFFGGNANSHPTGVIADSTGALYGEAGPTIFKLTPPTPGSPGWTESVLYQFRPENALAGSLLLDPKGDLFGVTEISPLAPYGTVFELIPPASGDGPWTKKTLYAFTGGADGRYPVSGLSQDATGALYGTTYQGGGSPNCNAFGVGCGVVFRLTPPAAGQTAWTESVLFAFNNTDGAVPLARLLLIGGAVYGTTEAVAGKGTGEIFELTPPNSGNGPWNETILYAFTGPADPNGLFADGKGNFYGLTSFGGDSSCGLLGCGTVFKLSPPVPPQTVWTLTTLFLFNDGSSGYFPDSLLLASNGVFYGTASNGGLSRNGTIYSLTP